MTTGSATRSATIKVPVELRDRLAALARRVHTTLAGAIARTLNATEDAAFWAEVGTTMGGAQAQQRIANDLPRLEGCLTDGLDPDENWDDVW